MKLCQQILIAFIFFINFSPSSWLHAAEEKINEVQEIPTLANLAGKICAQYIADMIKNNKTLDEPRSDAFKRLTRPYLNDSKIWNSLWVDLTRTDNLKNAKWLVQTDFEIPHDILHRCASKNSLALMKLFIQLGKDVNRKDELGDAPLHDSYDNPEMTKLLIDHGADVNLKNKKGKSALYRCMSIETYVSSAEELYENGKYRSLRKATIYHEEVVEYEKKIPKVIVQLILAGANDINTIQTDNRNKPYRELLSCQPPIQSHEHEKTQFNRKQAYEQRRQAYHDAIAILDKIDAMTIDEINTMTIEDKLSEKMRKNLPQNNLNLSNTINLILKKRKFCEIL